ncbi:DUF2116 family Zn-ribbon domain-containing protein [Candidatus Hecatella orcuttiae]|jgi:predicted nucleic acid-binding Zn ribbon protein|uniref:DUF2116 family Zn-ribbon domain-containing protein n=1 Tax=Candidatus Hecatella orcuttiae TaxID=1935119 RepID=UPI002867DD93|nr:DUF2116 family Zn-ribbon domain-containing protein [Candidatus Hecatella orcuttiae]
MYEKHRHCVVCDISISPEKNPPVCSKKCLLEYNKRMKKQQWVRLLMFIPLIAIMAMLLLGQLLGGSP